MQTEKSQTKGTRAYGVCRKRGSAGDVDIPVRIEVQWLIIFRTYRLTTIPRYISKTILYISTVLFIMRMLTNTNQRETCNFVMGWSEIANIDNNKNSIW